MESNSKAKSYAHLTTGLNLLQTSHIFLQAHTETSNSPKIDLFTAENDGLINSG